MGRHLNVKSGSQPDVPSGSLYICATPIGNLEDITLRVLRILKEVDLIAAEDTRVTRKLLSHFDISARTTSFYEHNEAIKSKEILEMLRTGRSVALVSDAGTPGISDPGHRLIKLCISENIPLVPLPGPSSLLTALVVSGLPTESFVFQGFLPRKRGERTKLLADLLTGKRTSIVFESPRRLATTLSEAAAIDPKRQTVVARELTKKFEQILRGTVSELRDKITQQPVKGEIVLLFGPPGEEYLKKPIETNDDNLREEVLKKINEGLTKKEAIASVARNLNIEKRRVYNATINRASK
jgi:16S rRNA (cytidine1402-2'-O)-methyltransferase